MYKMKYKYRNSSKNEFALNLLIILIAAILWFMGAEFFSNKAAIIVFALSIAVCYCRIAVEAIEKIISGKVTSALISTVAILIIFASQQFSAAAMVAIVYSLCKTVFDFICSLISDKLTKDDENKLKYDVVCQDDVKSVSAEELSEDDLVKVKKGDHLAFDYYVQAENGEKKRYKAGKFTVSDEALVEVIENVEYEIDFSESVGESETSKAEKVANIIKNIYTVAAVIIALVMFVIKTVNGDSLFDSLYIFGMYLLFANPLSIDSGILQAGLLSIKSLKDNGIKVKSTADVEKLSKVNKVFFSDSVAVCGEKANPDMVKAVKIADVLNLETELLCAGDEKESAVIANACDFKRYQSFCNEEKSKEIIAEQVIGGTVAYVCDKGCEQTKKVIGFSVDEGENRIGKTSLSALIKATKSTKFYKWFVVARAAAGAFINMLVIAFYASGIGDRFFANKLVETDMTVTSSTDGVSIADKLIKCFVYNDMMAPWIIALIHIFVINLFLFVTVCFLNNNKKLR